MSFLCILLVYYNSTTAVLLLSRQPVRRNKKPPPFADTNRGGNGVELFCHGVERQRAIAQFLDRACIPYICLFELRNLIGAE